jgi:hypothetical protein
VNNVVYNRHFRALDLQSEDGRSTRNSIVGNMFIDGPMQDSVSTKPIYIRTSGDLKLGSNSRVYVSDNRSPTYGSVQTALYVLTGGVVIPSLTSSSAPVWNSGLVARSTLQSAVYERVLTYAGARPTDRDAVDKRIVSEVRQRKGKFINCVSPNGTARCAANGGGWPSMPQNRRTLVLPADHTVIRSNGYSNLENWLHRQSQLVAGVMDAGSPTAPPSLSVQ